MLVVLMMLGGLIEIATIVFIFTLNFVMNMMGLMMEKHNQLTTKTSWFSFNVGVLAGIVPWIMGGMYFWVSTQNIADSVPVYAQFGFLLTFIFFNTFAVNMYLQYKKIGKWKDYVYGEKAYVVLSLTSKSLLDWKPLLGETSCVLDSKTYAAWKSGIQISATATVTRDRRWPTTYGKYKSYDWKKKSNDGLIFPTVVEWTLKIG